MTLTCPCLEPKVGRMGEEKWLIHDPGIWVIVMLHYEFMG